ncbi:winged helix-turn-helix transcriptional regulator [Halalkalibaculum sp. DA384]|uniref:winged helix-turn-helix transcriptional regulator n=1 Tax=Halalkalibaculum sp. DA384 TaxID=3373606 RepID=UPI0037545D5C
MSLQQEILKIVQSNNGIKAKDIANQLNADKSNVNSILYGELRDRVYQDNEYK